MSIKRITLLLAFYSCLLLACYRESDYEPAKRGTNNLLSINVQYNSLLADSSSLNVISLSLPIDVDSLKSTVVVKTDVGRFTENNNQEISVKLLYDFTSQKRIGEVHLKSPNKPGTASVSFSFESSTEIRQVSYDKRWPDSLYLEPSSFSIKPANNADGEATITGFLTAAAGYPSIGAQVKMEAFDSTYKKKIGQFRIYNNISDASCTTKFVYVLGDSTMNGDKYYGPIHLIAETARNAGGQPAKDTIHLYSSK